jgi:excisionase family DNA binding protein
VRRPGSAQPCGVAGRRAEFVPPVCTGSVALSADTLLTADEVAALLNVPVRWVREHTRNSQLPYVELGRYRRYRREAVLAYVVDQERGGAPWKKHRPRAL